MKDLLYEFLRDTYNKHKIEIYYLPTISQLRVQILETFIECKNNINGKWKVRLC